MDKKRKHSQRSDNSPSVSPVFKSCFCGMLISLASALVILCLTAVYALGKTDPESIMLPLSSFLAYPCAILGGFVSCKICKDSPVLCGLIYGLLSVTLSVALYPALPTTGTHSMSALSFFGLRGLLLICCIAGCLLGAKSLSNQKRHRRRRR